MECCIQMNRKDQTATVLQKTVAGTVLQVTDPQKRCLFTVKAVQDIPFAHKIAVREIQAGEEIYKFGAVIGRASADIRLGEHIHIHNIVSIKGAEEIRKREGR